jgi:Sap, sulfolipid-1-addressing protein
MWGTVLYFALGAAVDPVRLAVALFLMSRPRPMRNLLAYWLGAMATGIAVALGLLTLLRDFAPMVTQHVAAAAASATARHIQIAGGVLALPIAVLIAVGFSARQRARLEMSGGGPSVPVLQPSTPTAFSWLSTRAQNALESGCLWVAFGVGLATAPPPVEYLVVIAVIGGSGAAIGTQISAAVTFIVLMLAVVEIPLVSYLVTPAKTEAVMLQLCNWVRAHSRRILAVGLAVGGVVMVATGVGSP